MDRLAPSAVFHNLLEFNHTLLLKEILFLMTCSTSVQIYKNYGGQQVFISRVQTELIDSVFRWRFFFRFYLNVYPSLKFNIFFDIES
jgi:hypothetical protein